MKKLRNDRQKGITLIALVVTIVVLIILATVSILAVFGDNGIIARAQTAKDTHEKGKADETNTLDDYASYIGNYLDGKGGSAGGGSDTPTNPTACPSSRFCNCSSSCRISWSITSSAFSI